MNDQRDSYVRWRESDRLYVTCHTFRKTIEGQDRTVNKSSTQARYTTVGSGAGRQPDRLHGSQGSGGYFLSHFRRLVSDEPDGHDDQKERNNSNGLNQPCWLRWHPNPIDAAGEDFILLHHDPESNSLHRIGIEEQPIYPPTRRIQEFPIEPHSSWTAKAKKSHDRYNVTSRLSLPDTWEKLLEPDHTYDLLWTGKEVTHWDWGKPPQVGNEAYVPKWPPVLIPGGAHFTFTVIEGQPPPVPRPATPPPIQASERV